MFCNDTSFVRTSAELSSPGDESDLYKLCSLGALASEENVHFQPSFCRFTVFCNDVEVSTATNKCFELTVAAHQSFTLFESNVCTLERVSKRRYFRGHYQLQNSVFLSGTVKHKVGALLFIHH